MVESRDSQSWGNASTKGKDRGARSGIKMLEVEVSRANEQTKVNRSRKQERVRRSKIGWMGLEGGQLQWSGSEVGRSFAKLVPGCKFQAMIGWKPGRREGASGDCGAKARNGSWAAGDVDRGQQGGNVSY